MTALDYRPPTRREGRGGAVMASKPASTFVVRALPRPGGFVAQFAAPGLVPDYVRQGGGPVTFPTEAAALDAARRSLISVLEAQTYDKTPAGGYIRMSGVELATALTEAKLTPTLFAELYGVPQARVMKWLMGEQDIPHSAHVLVRLLAYEENFNDAVALTTHARQKGENDGRES